MQNEKCGTKRNQTMKPKKKKMGEENDHPSSCRRGKIGSWINGNYAMRVLSQRQYTGKQISFRPVLETISRIIIEFKQNQKQQSTDVH